MCNVLKSESAVSNQHKEPQWAASPFFDREKTNKLITSGVIREIKIIDQFEDQTLRALVNRYKTCTAICGYLSCALPLYLLSEHRFPFDFKFRNIDSKSDGIESKEDEQSESESAKTLQAIIDRLCDAQEISKYVSSAMQCLNQSLASLKVHRAHSECIYIG